MAIKDTLDMTRAEFLIQVRQDVPILSRLTDDKLWSVLMEAEPKMGATVFNPPPMPVLESPTQEADDILMDEIAMVTKVENKYLVANEIFNPLDGTMQSPFQGQDGSVTRTVSEEEGSFINKDIETGVHPVVTYDSLAGAWVDEDGWELGEWADVGESDLGFFEQTTEEIAPGEMENQQEEFRQIGPTEQMLTVSEREARLSAIDDVSELTEEEKIKAAARSAHEAKILKMELYEAEMKGELAIAEAELEALKAAERETADSADATAFEEAGEKLKKPVVHIDANMQKFGAFTGIPNPAESGGLSNWFLQLADIFTGNWTTSQVQAHNRRRVTQERNLRMGGAPLSSNEKVDWRIFNNMLGGWGFDLRMPEEAKLRPNEKRELIEKNNYYELMYNAANSAFSNNEAAEAMINTFGTTRPSSDQLAVYFGSPNALSPEEQLKAIQAHQADGIRRKYGDTLYYTTIAPLLEVRAGVLGWNAKMWTVADLIASITGAEKDGVVRSYLNNAIMGQSMAAEEANALAVFGEGVGADILENLFQGTAELALDLPLYQLIGLPMASAIYGATEGHGRGGNVWMAAAEGFVYGATVHTIFSGFRIKPWKIDIPGIGVIPSALGRVGAVTSLLVIPQAVHEQLTTGDPDWGAVIYHGGLQVFFALGAKPRSDAPNLIESILGIKGELAEKMGGGLALKYRTSIQYITDGIQRAFSLTGNNRSDFAKEIAQRFGYSEKVSDKIYNDLHNEAATQNLSTKSNPEQLNLFAKELENIATGRKATEAKDMAKSVRPLEEFEEYFYMIYKEELRLGTKTKEELDITAKRVYDQESEAYIEEKIKWKRNEEALLAKEGLDAEGLVVAKKAGERKAIINAEADAVESPLLTKLVNAKAKDVNKIADSVPMSELRELGNEYGINARSKVELARKIIKAEAEKGAKKTPKKTPKETPKESPPDLTKEYKAAILEGNVEMAIALARRGGITDKQIAGIRDEIKNENTLNRKGKRIVNKASHAVHNNLIGNVVPWSFKDIKAGVAKKGTQEAEADAVTPPKVTTGKVSEYKPPKGATKIGKAKVLKTEEAVDNYIRGIQEQYLGSNLFVVREDLGAKGWKVQVYESKKPFYTRQPGVRPLHVSGEDLTAAAMPKELPKVGNIRDSAFEKLETGLAVLKNSYENTKKLIDLEKRRGIPKQQNRRLLSLQASLKYISKQTRIYQDRLRTNEMIRMDNKQRVKAFVRDVNASGVLSKGGMALKDVSKKAIEDAAKLRVLSDLKAYWRLAHDVGITTKKQFVDYLRDMGVSSKKILAWVEKDYEELSAMARMEMASDLHRVLGEEGVAKEIQISPGKVEPTMTGRMSKADAEKAYAGNLKLENITDDPQIQALIRKQVEIIGEGVYLDIKKTKSWSEVEESAYQQHILKQYHDIVHGKESTGLNLEQIIYLSTTDLLGSVKALTKNPDNPDVLNLAVLSTLGAIKIRGDVGAGLNFLKNNNYRADMARIWKWRQENPELMKKYPLLKHIMDTFMNKSDKNSLLWGLMELRVSNLFASVSMLVRNFVGNPIMAGVEIARIPIAAGINLPSTALARAIYGKENVQRGIYQMELPAMIYGAMTHFKTGLKNALRALAEDEVALSKSPFYTRNYLFRKYIPGGWIGGKGIRTPLRAAAAVDMLFHTPLAGGFLMRAGVRDAYKNGKRGWTDVMKHAEEFANNASDATLEWSSEKGAWSTYQSQLGWLGKHVNSFRQGESPGAAVMFSFVPVYTTPVNLFKRSYDLLPGFGMISSRFTSSLNNAFFHLGKKHGATEQYSGKRAWTTEDFSNSVATQMIGYTMFVAATSWLEDKRMSGEITGSWREMDTEERDYRIKVLGQMEKSIFIGDKWVSYDRFDPMTNLITAELEYIDGKDVEWGIRFADAVGVLGRQFADNPFFSGINDIFKFFDGTIPLEKWAARYSRGYYLPTFMSQIRRVVDPYRRETTSTKQLAPFAESYGEAQLEGFKSEFAAQLPWLTDTNLPELDFFGNEVKITSPVWAMLGFMISEETKDPTSLAIAELFYGVKPNSKENYQKRLLTEHPDFLSHDEYASKLKLTPIEHWQILKYAGQAVHAAFGVKLKEYEEIEADGTRIPLKEKLDDLLERKNFIFYLARKEMLHELLSLAERVEEDEYYAWKENREYGAYSDYFIKMRKEQGISGEGIPWVELHLRGLEMHREMMSGESGDFGEFTGPQGD